MATYTFSGSWSDAKTKVALQASGDTYLFDANNTYTGWGAGAEQIAFTATNLTITTVNGAATIGLSATGPVSNDKAVIAISGSGTKFFGTSSNRIIFTGINNGADAVLCLSVGNCTGVRLGYLTYNAPTNGGYFGYISNAYGVSDNVVVVNGAGTLQTFMLRGPTSAWNTGNTMGTANAWYIEDSTISAGYMNENDGAAQSVLRFCTAQGVAYADAHMIETATDASGVYHGSRQFEIYGNDFTGSGDFIRWMEFYGGTGMVFNNICKSNQFAIFGEYGVVVGSGGSGLAYIPTPAHSPIPDQVGTGSYPQSAGQEPLNYWNNRKTNSSGVDSPLQTLSVNAAAITAYGSTFYMTSEDGSPYMFLRGRDYFKGVVGGTFPSTTDVGIGTAASMAASSPTAAGQKWWVTDEGSWNTLLPVNTSGRLYQWSGSAWVLHYTPYTYPHPLRNVTSTTSRVISGNVTLAGKVY